MFDLPKGMPVDEEIDVADGVIQPFAHGAISTWIGKRKTLQVIGWLEQEELLAGLQKARKPQF